MKQKKIIKNWIGLETIRQENYSRVMDDGSDGRAPCTVSTFEKEDAMSVVDMELFRKFLKENPDELERAIALGTDTAKLVELAAGHGFSLETSDFGAMSEDELEGIAGGGRPSSPDYGNGYYW